MHDYVLYLLITLILSGIFSMGGAEAGLALIPIFNFLGLGFTVAKAVGLFTGASTTITSSVMNIKRKAVDFKFVFPIALMMVICAPLGAYSSSFIDENLVKFIYMLLLFYSAAMMMFSEKKRLFHAESKFTLFTVRAAVGCIVPFSALGSFFTYATYVPLDWVLLSVVAFSAIVGGYIGDYFMHFKLKQSHIKKLMAGLLYLLALKLLWHFII
ncbi:sulfite exporter TauE/SafE family protein [Sulfurimonas autotrophica]|uniref:Probable membrane transporter protein n=1 Tax=Sulfurimonas autotrophica (strain ATCC BAA-671 / DSM 16294 / JCM 11897 / OK10) TaxID=563040 RepID=E0UQ49_SULAO|nr:sulfite exporter TauE/SafE family protein [Sulfurimonas autotrophica]ADN08724.1 protein of unknown function DUF81 [Sulfurimonas autotrophica DSM 16294]